MSYRPTPSGGGPATARCGLNATGDAPCSDCGMLLFLFLVLLLMLLLLFLSLWFRPTMRQAKRKYFISSFLLPVTSAHGQCPSSYSDLFIKSSPSPIVCCSSSDFRSNTTTEAIYFVLPVDCS